MIRIIENYTFLLNASKSYYKFSSLLKSANEEQIKAIAECVINNPTNTNLQEFTEKIRQCKSLAKFKALFQKNQTLIRSCIIYILSEVLSCALASEDASNSNESDSGTSV